MEMAFMQQGGLKDDGMKQDPISGNPIPNGSMAEEVRDDIPAQLSEGEYVVPADVVRYYGVKHFEDIRNKAKTGLQNMEKNGRIGGEPVPVGGPKAGPMMPQQMPQQQMANNLSQDEMNEIKSMVMNVGGFVEQPINVQQPTDPYQQQNTMYKQPMAMADGGFSYYNPDDMTATTKAITTASPLSGSFSESPAQQAAKIVADVAKVENKVTLYGPNGEEVSVIFPSEEYNKYISQGYTTAKPVTPKDDDPRDPGGTSAGGGTGSGFVGFEDFGKDVDWSDPEAYAKKIFEGASGQTKVGETGAALATLAGVPALGIVAGIGSAYKTGQAISRIKTAKILAEAQGLPTDNYDKYAKTLLENAGGILKIGDQFNLLDGVAQAKIVLDRNGFKYKDDDDGNPIFKPKEINYNRNISTTTTTPTTTTKDGGPSLAESMQKQQAKKAGDAASALASSGDGSYGVAEQVADRQASISYGDEEEDLITQINKGGLMRKKKTKGK